MGEGSSAWMGGGGGGLNWEMGQRTLDYRQAPGSLPERSQEPIQGKERLGNREH